MILDLKVSEDILALRARMKFYHYRRNTEWREKYLHNS